ncbi:MAG TPA: hypothetical protein VMU42_16940 [Candidatus Sulfotelmatobacter sp.]|nr:hypothetical protein [Candidatus Sulfotelmatobacter sp.]
MRVEAAARRFAPLLLLAVLGGCSGGDGAPARPAADAPASAAEATDPEAFKARLEARLPDCARRVQSTKGLSAADAQAFCSCQLDITAAKTTAAERAAVLKMTFKSADDRVSEAEAKTATDALMRLQPEVTKTCMPQ